MLSYDPTKFVPQLDQGEIAVSTATALGEGRYNFVKVQNPRFDFAGVANAKNILIGTATRQRWFLVPGESSDWLPIEKLSDVWARSSDASEVVITYFVCRLNPIKGSVKE